MDAASPQKIFLDSVVFLLSICRLCESKIVSGIVDTGPSENWVFIARFCFLSEKGSLNFRLLYPEEYSVQNIVLYYDSADQWPLVYGPKAQKKTCQEKESVLRSSFNQVINLTSGYPYSGCREMSLGDRVFLNCTGGRTFRSARERWWFIALSNCGSTKGLYLDYQLHMKNADVDDLFYEELSADEFYIPQVYISFLAAYVLISIASFCVAACLSERQLLHTTYKMYMYSVMFEVMALLFAICYYVSYGKGGVQNRSLHYVGKAAEATSVLIFVLMLILMGKGYTLTRGRISYEGTVKIAVFMTVYVLTYIALFVWETAFFDPGLVLYIYESPPGYGLIALRLGGWLWFAYTVFFTIKHYPTKRAFYSRFFAFFTVWFWASPIVIFIAMRVMYPWVREKVVVSVELCVALCGHAVFLILTRPTAANKNFPYHVRTSQIGIIDTRADTGKEDNAFDSKKNPYLVEEQGFKDLDSVG